MMSQHEPDPWQQDYDRWKAAGFPRQDTGPRQNTQPGQPAVPGPATAAVPPRQAVTVPPRRLIIGGLIAILVVIAAVIGHSIASSNSIAVGDCVVTNPSFATGWDIKKVACGSDPGSALFVQKVESVQDGTNGECAAGMTTFEDDPAGKTYCLTAYSFFNGG